MYKLMILIDPPFDTQTFEESWPRFLHEAEKMPGLRREATIQVVENLYGNPRFYKIHELFFENKKSLKEAMASSIGQATGKILQEITSGRMSLLIAEHKEERIKNIRKYHETNLDSN